MIKDLSGRWSSGGWEVLGIGAPRGDAPGWMIEDGILVFGGWYPPNEMDLKSTRLIDKDFDGKSCLNI